MLASDDELSSPVAVHFSLASDIVELVVLTVDEPFLQTLREALGGARRLWHVPSATQVSDLLIAGQVGIVVIDVQALSVAADVFVAQIKRQFPDLVVVVAGQRDAEIRLAALISAGTVYRFIHKPVSPGRAKLFAEAAIKKYAEQPRPASARPSARPRRVRAWGIGGGALALVLVLAAAGHWHADPAVNGAGRADGGAPRSAESALLARAAAALAANRLTQPAGDNALELYLQATARSPADAAARLGLAEVRERLLARAENALLEERLEEAATAIETARRSGVESGTIAFLSAQLAKAQTQLRAAQAASRTRLEAKAERSRARQYRGQPDAAVDGSPTGTGRVEPAVAP